MQGQVNLETRLAPGGVTRTAALSFTAPYSLMHPFVRPDFTEYMVMSSSAGLLAGDSTEFDFRFGAGTSTKITTQSYEKVLDTAKDSARKSIHIVMADGARASVLPLPTIPFAGSTCLASTDIELAPSSALLYAEVIACGRIARGERFAMHRLSSVLNVHVDGKPVLRDALLLDPALFDHEGPAQWGTFTHCASAYIHVPIRASDHVEQTGGIAASADDDVEADRVALISEIRALQAGKQRVMVGATEAVDGISVRIMAMSGQHIMRTLAQIETLFTDHVARQSR